MNARMGCNRKARRREDFFGGACCAALDALLLVHHARRRRAWSAISRMTAYETANSGAQNSAVEVDQQRHGQTGQPEIRNDLSGVHGLDLSDGLHLYDQPMLDDEVEAISTVDFDPLVGDRNGALPFESKVPQLQLTRKACAVRRLEQPRPELTMDFDAGPDGLPRKIQKPSRLRAFLLHSSGSIRAQTELLTNRRLA